MALSYFATDVIKLSDAPYLNWFLYDLITILVISFWLLVKSVKLFTASIYVIAGLLLNASFMLSMHYDIFILGNREPWLLWSVFSIGVNLLDLMMIIAIASNKDFLLLKKFVKYPMSSSEKPERIGIDLINDWSGSRKHRFISSYIYYVGIFNGLFIQYGQKIFIFRW